MSTYSLLQLENATLSKINLKNGLNIISSYFCIDIHNNNIAIIPIRSGIINGNILENETQLEENDILKFGASHYIVRKVPPIIIDLTKEDSDEENNTDDVTPPHAYYYNRNSRLTSSCYASSPSPYPSPAPSPNWD